MSKRILLVMDIYSPNFGGPATYVQALARRLAIDKKVTVLTYSLNRKIKEDKEEKFKIIQVWKKMPRWWRHFFYTCRILWEVCRQDLIFVLDINHGGLSSILAGRLFKKRIFVKIIGDESWQRAVEKGQTFLLMDDWQAVKKSGWAAWHWYKQNLIARKADRIIVSSHYLKKITENWGVNSKKIKVVYDGADFQPDPSDKEEARKKIGIAGNIIISVGRLAPWKGFRMLIKIMPKLLQINQFFRLVIIGSGPEEKNLRAIVKNMRLEKKVYLVGQKTDKELAVFLAAGDIFVLNTAYEGFSQQILKAMKAGLPVITTAVGGNKEIIQQGENGFMVKYNDEFNLVEAVKAVWSMPELRTRFIANGQKTAAYFSAEKMLKETVKLISEELNYA